MNAPRSVRAECPAKVNLFLEVLERRDDGFHEIETVFQEVRLSDTLTFAPAESGIDITVLGADLPEGKGNLVVRAARLYLDLLGGVPGLRIRLVKRIPVMAGLGGGSSDAASTLLALRDLLHPDLPTANLSRIAEDLGSDVPFFLEGGAAHATGRGEQLPTDAVSETVLDGDGVPTVRLVHRQGLRRGPGSVVSGAPDPDLLFDALRFGRDPGPALFNRLEEAALEMEPKAAAFRAELSRMLLPGEHVMLSGSGSTFFVPTVGVARATDLARAISASGIGRGLAVRTA